MGWLLDEKERGLADEGSGLIVVHVQYIGQVRRILYKWPNLIRKPGRQECCFLYVASSACRERPMRVGVRWSGAVFCRGRERLRD